jgi:acyl-CoA thioester hydrolase
MYKPRGNVFTFSNRVYFGDTDAAGVVYHGKYVYWMEAARIEMLDDLGYPYTDLQTDSIGFVPTHVDITYKHPLRFGDRFTILSRFVETSYASLTIANEFRLDDKLCCSGIVKLAVLNEKDWKPVRTPANFLRKLQQYEETRR